MPTPHDPVCHASPECTGPIQADVLNVTYDGVAHGTPVPGYDQYDFHCVSLGFHRFLRSDNFYAKLSDAINREGFYTVRRITVFWNATAGPSGGYPPGVNIISDDEGDVFNTCFSQLGSDCNIVKAELSMSEPDLICVQIVPTIVADAWWPVTVLQCDGGCMTRDGECCACVGGIWDPLTQWCYDDPCDECYCALLDVCQDCREPRCKDELNCAYNKDTCNWECDDFPNCGPNYHWDNNLCLCVTCPPEECYCEANGRCIPCEPPPCADELNCAWDKNTCEWLCDSPNCAPGYNWDEPSCSCVPDCEPGECWCDDPYDPYDGSCIPCIPPDCAEELNCYWSTTTCDWVCDDPDERCGPMNEWDYDLCSCGGTLSCHLRDTNGQFVLIHISSTGTLVAERYDADDEEEETNEIDDDTSCGDPCCWLIDGVIVVLYRRGHVPKLAISYTHGRAWEIFEVPGEYSRLCSMEHRNRLVIMGFRSGVWYQRVGKIPLEGDVEWSEEVDSQVEQALDPVVPPTGNGHLRDPVDNVISMMWEDTGGTWHLSLCRAIDLNALGEWVIAGTP